MANRHNPFYPIIYVRGYAMTQKEIDETTADPFCGFNLGSTVFRAVPDRERPPRKYIFESPVVRLASDFGYSDVYEDGYDILDPEWADDKENRLPSRAIVVYRYYDEASQLLGKGKTPPIEKFSADLGSLILKVRELVCANRENGVREADFRCYLVAHSMGGLVCRGLLQNPADKAQRDAVACVDKFFTYATPHNGIDMAGINIPSWLSLNDLNNFSREKMAPRLGLAAAYKKTERADWVQEDRFDIERIFCMVGTNRSDYEVAFGASRTFAGHGSDGLVRIENATLMSLKADGTPGTPCAKAFTYRAHSGFFGIVNSEESYQNLSRFLFGDVRVDVWLDVAEIRLPPAVEKKRQAGDRVDALYQVELLASPRGKLWYLTRRTSEEDSVACLTQESWDKNPGKCPLYLSTVFLANRSRVNKKRKTLAYSVSLGVRVPDYEVERKLWTDEHYEGGYLFRNAVVLELTPPDAAGGQWRVKYAWQDQGSAAADIVVDTAKLKLKAGKLEVPIEVDSKTAPGIKGTLRFVVSLWNPDAEKTE